MGQEMNVALRCIICEIVSCCIIGGKVCHCDTAHYCRVLDVTQDAALFEVQPWVCGKCQEVDDANSNENMLCM